MKNKTFSLGGVHLAEHKISADMPIKELALPDKVYIPIKQHLGAPAKIIVKQGDKVKVGTLLAQADGEFSANVFSSISGEVTKIEDIDSGQGYLHTVITIKREGDEFEQCMDLSEDIVTEISEDREEMLEAIRSAGIIGMGGAGFPTFMKVRIPEDKKVDTLIVNGIECEPYITSDSRLMEEKAEQIVIGARILNKILGIQHAIIAIDENKPRAIEKLENITKGYIGVNVQSCRNVYPQGSEKQLVEAVTGREIPCGKLPIDANCVVQNVATVYAIYEAVQKHIPLFRRVLTVSGNAALYPDNYWVRIGTPVSFILKQNQAPLENVGKVLLGGPMMGQTIATLEVPVTKTTSGIILLKEAGIDKPETSACIRCGKCIDACPIGLMPLNIHEAVEYNERDNLKKLHVQDCILCGSCSYVCPAKIPLLDYCKIGKYELSKQNQKV